MRGGGALQQESSALGARGLDFCIPILSSHWLLVSLGWSCNLPGKVTWLSQEQVSGRGAAVTCHQPISRAAGGGGVGGSVSRNHSICRREDGIFWYRRNFSGAGAYRVRHPGGCSLWIRVASSGGGEKWLDFGY